MASKRLDLIVLVLVMTLITIDTHLVWIRRISVEYLKQFKAVDLTYFELNNHYLGITLR